ncbi:hypothetical protein CRUP_023074 [Coryphaenoides rupestris]|nr:hypothetical protein CRUP_023074 [Coryphaenoides rupestris]
MTQLHLSTLPSCQLSFCPWFVRYQDNRSSPFLDQVAYPNQVVLSPPCCTWCPSLHYRNREASTRPPHLGPYPSTRQSQLGSYHSTRHSQLGSYPSTRPSQLGPHPSSRPSQLGPSSRPSQLGPSTRPSQLGSYPSRRPSTRPSQLGPHPSSRPSQLGPYPSSRPSQLGSYPSSRPSQLGPHPSSRPSQPGPYPSSRTLHQILPAGFLPFQQTLPAGFLPLQQTLPARSSPLPQTLLLSGGAGRGHGSTPREQSPSLPPTESSSQTQPEEEQQVEEVEGEGLSHLLNELSFLNQNHSPLLSPAPGAPHPSLGGGVRRSGLGPSLLSEDLMEATQANGHMQGADGPQPNRYGALQDPQCSLKADKLTPPPLLQMKLGGANVRLSSGVRTEGTWKPMPRLAAMGLKGGPPPLTSDFTSNLAQENPDVPPQPAFRSPHSSLTG